VELTFTQFRILFEAADSASLGFLPARSRSSELGPAEYDWPEMPLDEVREALLQLVEGDYVYVGKVDGRRLPTAAARRVIADNRSWEFPMEDEDYYVVGLTDRGASALEENVQCYWPAGAPQRKHAPDASD
jgi:hypothetical protein